MLKMFYKAINNDKGFTLIELIVVIAVLGILAAVALPRISGVTSSAKESADIATVKTINNAIEIYIAESGDDDLTNLGGTNATTVIANLVSGISGYGPYLKEAPVLKNGGSFSISDTLVTTTP